VNVLHELGNKLVPYHNALVDYRKKMDELKEESSEGQPSKIQTLIKTHPRKPKGVYLHGHVGTGKTLLMDMFFQNLELSNKRRVHLHDFMIDVHERIHSWKLHKREKFNQVSVDRFFAKESDGISEIGKQIALETTLLAFDEFVVTDVVDALILKHLFGEMFKNGVVVVATSNTSPENLYKEGLNYFYFAPFITMLHSHCKILNMDSSLDYRIAGAASYDEPSTKYIFPLNALSVSAFNNKYQFLVPEEDSARYIDVAFGRKLLVRRSGKGVCRFKFSELCSDSEPVMGSTDFQALSGEFSTVMIEDVPFLGKQNQSETRRFITLIDHLYDNNIGLIMTAAAPPLQLFENTYLPDESLVYKELEMAGRRMTSRLVEMCF